MDSKIPYDIQLDTVCTYLVALFVCSIVCKSHLIFTFIFRTHQIFKGLLTIVTYLCVTYSSLLLQVTFMNCEQDQREVYQHLFILSQNGSNFQIYTYDILYGTYDMWHIA